MKMRLKKMVTYGLYPLVLAVVILVMYDAIHYHWDYKKVYGLVTLGLILTLVSMEFIFPLSKEWKMTGRSFLRDLKYIVIDATLIGLSKAGFGILAIYYSEHHKGLFSSTPLIIGLIVYLLVFEFFQYWYHRLSHEAKGKTGKVLWGIHLAHHLPDKVYVIMHAVFNPLNAFVTVIIVQTPLILLGVPPEVAFITGILIDLQTTISHFNVDIRAGLFNYLFIGTELHRHHHSADKLGSKNYGSVLSIWDIVFGSFYYKPGVIPQRLGVYNPELYPASEDIIKVVTYPFRNSNSLLE